MKKYLGGNWDLTDKPHTQRKLDIFEAYFDAWITIWNKHIRGNELIYVDIFAGPGKYKVKDGFRYGSPLIFLDKIREKIESGNLRSDLTFYLFLVEQDGETFRELMQNIDSYLEQYPFVGNRVKIPSPYNEDCNTVIDNLISQIHNPYSPMLLVIDPSGLQIKNITIEKLLKLKNRKDVFFTYILEGVKRVSGVVSKILSGKELQKVEFGSVEKFKSFFGIENLAKIPPNIRKDHTMLTYFVNSVFVKKDYRIVAYPMPYPRRRGTIYLILFASKNPKVVNVADNIYNAVHKKSLRNLNLFNLPPTIRYGSKVGTITRKSLLYKTKVEYGNWTINHILGCAHGCKFPCYAFMMAKRYGKVKDYRDWRHPKIVSNALQLLEKEIPKYKHQINFVHLSFTTDPFMYDFETGKLFPEIKELTLNIIEKLNRSGIKVTTLTKGYYPDELLDTSRFSTDNEYGITLVSLNLEFKNNFEPYSAPYEIRIESLKKLHDAGLKTWVSIEPYPTPNIDPSAHDIESLLEKIGFVDKIIFGKLNYNVRSTRFKDNQGFYEGIARKVIDFCNTKGITLHIKEGTPLSELTPSKIF